jgi:hypothetical protein
MLKARLTASGHEAAGFISSITSAASGMRDRVETSRSTETMLFSTSLADRTSQLRVLGTDMA